MKFIKQLTCLIACFVVLSSSFIVGYAVDEPPEYIFTHDDMVDMGFVYDSYRYTYNGLDDPFDFGFSTLITTEKNFPDFDVYNDIPWSTFPSYIQDIVYMPLDDLNKSFESGVSVQYLPSFIVPFVGVQVTNNGTVANVFVGTNVGLGFINNGYLSYSIFSYDGPDCDLIFKNSKLYRLRVDLVNGNIVDWTEYKGEAYGNSGFLYRMLSWNTGADTGIDDWYLYGANGINYCYHDNNGVSTPTTGINVQFDKSDTKKWVGFYTYPSGFKSGKFLYNQTNGYPYTYFQYFEPPSRASLSDKLQQEQNSLLDEQNNKLDNMMDATGKPDSIVDDYNKAESELVDGYNPDDLSGDLDIEFDDMSIDFIWYLIEYFLRGDNGVFTLFISLLSVGIISLILGR